MRWFVALLAVVLLYGLVVGLQAAESETPKKAEAATEVETPKEAPADEPGSEVIVPPTSTWKWLHPSDGVDPATEMPDFNKKFMAPDFDDSKWKEGKDSDKDGGGFGYGDPVGVKWDTPEVENRKTGYLRHKFTTKQPMEKLSLKLQLDDGAIIYIEGKEVGREGVGDGKEAYDLMSEKVIGGDAEKEVVAVKLAGGLKPGEHVLAISLHNRPDGSSDLRIAQITLRGVPEKKTAK